jgi:ADP-ribose pyrophosphatase
MSNAPEIVSRDANALSPWVTLVTRGLASAGGRIDYYHSLQQSDYVTVLAETEQGEVVLVRQFRPILEKYTIELPGGLREGGLEPAATACRELEEETGFRAIAPPTLLGCLEPDSGRLENRFWCFYTNEIAPIDGWRAEPGVERLLMPKRDFFKAIQSGEFTMALHIAIVGLALIHNKLSFS